MSSKITAVKITIIVFILVIVIAFIPKEECAGVVDDQIQEEQQNAQIFIKDFFNKFEELYEQAQEQLQEKLPDGGGARTSIDGRLWWPLTDNSYYTTRHGHAAVDIPANYGTEIYAAADGIITYAGWCGTYGYYVQIWHPDLGLTTGYAHQPNIQVSIGQEIKKGDKIGIVGSTGRSTGPHLHFEIYDCYADGGNYQSHRLYASTWNEFFEM